MSIVSQRNSGELFFTAITTWERERANNEFLMIATDNHQLMRRVPADDGEPPRQTFADQLTGIRLVPLNALWYWPLNMPPDSNMLKIMRVEATATVAFIDTQFGADRVTRFLHSMATAQTFSEAIESSLGLKVEEFEGEWLKWIEK